MIVILRKNILHMECLRDPYSDPFYLYYTSMIFLKRLTYCLQYYLHMTLVSVFIEGTSYNNIINDMNRELEKVDKWLKSNKLTVNIKKTQYMLFHRTRIKHKVHEDRVHISGSNLVKVNNIKFLGVIIDSKLNWSDHITYIKNKISKSIGILTKIRRFLNKKSLRNLYYSFLYPYLTYCVEVCTSSACFRNMIISPPPQFKHFLFLSYS